MMKKKTIILAYSGGLDTSVILHWLKENYNANIVAYIADLGQNENLKSIAAQAKKVGASKVYLPIFAHRSTVLNRSRLSNQCADRL